MALFFKMFYRFDNELWIRFVYSQFWNHDSPGFCSDTGPILNKSCPWQTLPLKQNQNTLNNNNLNEMSKVTLKTKRK